MAIRAIDESTVPHGTIPADRFHFARSHTLFWVPCSCVTVGIVAGTFVDDSTSKTENKVDSLFGRILQVSALAEKPHVETAREHFTSMQPLLLQCSVVRTLECIAAGADPALSPGRYFGAFGLYILEPQVWRGALYPILCLRAIAHTIHAIAGVRFLA